jgi:hypothetical protein
MCLTPCQIQSKHKIHIKFQSFINQLSMPCFVGLGVFLYISLALLLDDRKCVGIISLVSAWHIVGDPRSNL